MKADFIIIGQGLAGTHLAWRLHLAGAKVCVIDNSWQGASSPVAAGLYNPITGKKMVKTWKGDLLFDEMESWYPKLEKLSEEKFFIDSPIYRPFVSIEEQNEWMGKSAAPEFSSYVEQCHTRSRNIFGVSDEFGGISLARSGYLKIPAFLKSSRAYFEERGMYRKKQVGINDIRMSKGKVELSDISAGKLIFAEGERAIVSHFFGNLPFRPVKGEVLTISANLSFDFVLNRGVFVIPLGDGRFRVGSTYNWRDRSLIPSEEARKEICEKLEKLISVPYTIIDQVCGIRPATADRRPIVGQHPRFEQIAIFNGLGTKGVSLAPYFSLEMSQMLLQGKEISAEVNIARYESLY